MKYDKGTFTIIPNRELLRGQDPQTQVLYMWLCSYADDKGVCFPSFSRLAKDCGIGRMTVIRRIQKLEDIGLLVKTNRTKDSSKISNEYQLVVSERDYHSTTVVLPTSHSETTLVSEVDIELYPLNSNQLTQPTELKGRATAPPKRSDPKRTNATYNPLGAELIRAFEPINPAAKRFYANTTQREACDDLLDAYGLEKTKQVIAILPKTNLMKYAPTITTPLQLRDKWAQLEAHVRKKQVELVAKKSSIAFS